MLEFAGHKGWDNDPQRQPLRLCPCGRHIRSGELTEQLQRAVLRLIQHEFLQRHLSFFIKLLLSDPLCYVWLISVCLDVTDHRGHGKQGEEQCHSHQHHVGRILLQPNGRTQKGEGDDIPGKGGHHHHNRGEECDQGSQK